MLYFKYEEWGQPVTEFNWEKWINSVLKDYKAGKDVTYSVCTPLPFLAVRREIALKNIRWEDVIFVVENEEYKLTKEGFTENPLPGHIFRVEYNLVCNINRIYKNGQ